MNGHGKRNTVYELDFHAWADEQATLLRAGRLSDIDAEHIAEEIEALGRGERHELTSRLSVLLLHLLKWSHQPDLRGRSWELTIKEQRRQLARHLKKNPSLKPWIDEAMAERVAAASARFADGHDDLRARTAQQAGALQQTAASMAQLGTTVEQSADKARQANQAALGASAVLVGRGM